jgi:hypothetical protein
MHALRVSIKPLRCGHVRLLAASPTLAAAPDLETGLPDLPALRRRADHAPGGWP